MSDFSAEVQRHMETLDDQAREFALAASAKFRPNGGPFQELAQARLLRDMACALGNLARAMTVIQLQNKLIATLTKEEMALPPIPTTPDSRVIATWIINAEWRVLGR